MPNEQNLIPNSERSPEELREQTRKGGIASGEARRKKRDLRLALEVLLESEFTDKNGTKMTGAEAITSKLFEQAMKGNVRAFETLRDTVGQKPIEKVEVSKADREQSLQELKELFDDE